MMFQWRFKLRKAEEAYKSGRLEEAQRILTHDDLLQYLPAQKLSTKVASAMAGRARQRAIAGDTAAGWDDLARARALGGETEPFLMARSELIERALSEAENYLEADDPGGAMLRLETLEKKGVASDRLRSLKQISRRLERARSLSRLGKFADAEVEVASAAALCQFGPQLAERRQRLAEQAVRAREIHEALHRAQSEDDWSRVLSLACELLEMAPDCAVAREARKRAWAKAGTTFASHAGANPQTWAGSYSAGNATALAEPATANRFLLWVDAVGGYLVCLEDEVVIGQASPGNHVDVPILGDVSRRHAVIRRQGEGYVLEPLGEVAIDGRGVTTTTLLHDGEEIQLGPSVRLRFRKPHALSASARLDFTSRHRTQPSADAVLLMAESCVLGPNWHNHVVCRGWPDDVVLFQQDDELYCRAMESIEVDGQLCDGRGKLSRNSHVSGDEFSLSLEEIRA